MTDTEIHAAIYTTQTLLKQAADVIEHNANSLAEAHARNGIIEDSEVQAAVESDIDLVAHLRAAALPWDQRHKSTERPPRRDGHATPEQRAAVRDELQQAAEVHGLAEQPAQTLPFGIGGGLVAIKTLLSRDPCVHANTAIQMIDAMLAEQPAQREDWGPGPHEYHSLPAQQEPSKQEPVACSICNGSGHIAFDDLTRRNKNDNKWGRCLHCQPYAAPQPAQQEPVAWQKIECPICGDMAIATDIPAAQRKPLGYAGITIWGGDATVTKVFTETQMEFAREPRSLIEAVVGQCLDELAAHNIKGQS